MEDPREEYWEIQEYTSSDEGESNTNTRSSRVSWLLDKGLNLGKKIVITAIVISSAPLVLPPLVVISALGFGLSVPFGFAFASYACTQKLMDKLLPYPTSSSSYPLMLENGTVLSEEEKEEEPMKEVEESVKEVGYGEDFGDYLDASKAEDYGNQSTEKNKEEPMNLNVIVDEKVKEKVSEEDVAIGEYLEGEDHDEGTLNLEGKFEVKIEDEEEEPVMERSKGPPLEELLVEDNVDQVVVSVDEDGKNASVESDLVEERGGETAKEINAKNFTTIIEEMETSLVEDTSMKSEMKRAEDERKLEGPKENKEIIQERGNKENVEMGSMIEGNRDDKKNVEHVVVIEDPIEDLNGSINEKRLGEAVEMENNKAAMESGGTKNQIGSVVQKEPKGSAEFLELDVSVEVHEIKDAGIDSETDTPMPASKVSEEKIWEQIDALRTIVGYKAAPHATCAEELKALYIFTGVEPPEPVLYKNQPSDLIEVNDTLLFLMSIVGVK
ncbi:unnamed protein product [Camellia sinensis]